MEGGQGQDGICNGLNAGVQQMQSRNCGLERQGEKSRRMRPREVDRPVQRRLRIWNFILREREAIFRFEIGVWERKSNTPGCRVENCFGGGKSECWAEKYRRLSLSDGRDSPTQSQRDRLVDWLWGLRKGKESNEYSGNDMCVCIKPRCAKVLYL